MWVHIYWLDTNICWYKCTQKQLFVLLGCCLIDVYHMYHISFYSELYFYLTAIVFDKEHKNGLESHVKYSIRMNQDRVDTTNKIQNRWV